MSYHEKKVLQYPYMRRWMWGGLVLFFVLFSFVPTLYDLARQGDLHADRSFELVHNYYTDYNFYLSRIRQGLEGNLLVHEKYTSEPHSGSLFQIAYLAMGWVGEYLHVPWDRSGDIYHVARFIFAFLVLVLIVRFCKETLGKLTSEWWTLIGFLLAVTASSWPKLVLEFDGWRLQGYMLWFTVTDSLQRITFLPHILIGQALMIFLIMAMASRKTLARSKNWIFLGILALVLCIIYPPGLIVVAATCAFLWIFDRIFWPRVVIGFMSIPAVVYIFLMVTIYPWKRLTEFDILNPLAFNLWEYIMSIGPLLPLGLIGLTIALFKKERALKSAMAWILAFFTIFIAFHFIPQQHPLRFSETLPHVPLAILTAYLFVQIANINLGVGKTRLHLGFVAGVISIIIILTGVGIMYSSWLWQRDFTDHKISATIPLVPSGNYVMYPLKDFVAGMIYLGATTPRDSIVLSMQTTGNYIPVYAGNTVYFGHANTVKYEKKKILVESFFAGTMDPNIALQWIHGAGISYVYFGPQEQEFANIRALDTTYPFLQLVYTNPHVIIYRVNK